VDDARLLALEQGQAQITAMLQQVLLQSSSPPATAVAMGPAAGLASMSTSSLPVPEALPTIATMSSGICTMTYQFLLFGISALRACCLTYQPGIWRISCRLAYQPGI
jgi:hypothetical protein